MKQYGLYCAGAEREAVWARAHSKDYRTDGGGVEIGTCMKCSILFSMSIIVSSEMAEGRAFRQASRSSGRSNLRLRLVIIINNAAIYSI